MSEEWSEWFLHDGRGCPVPIGTMVWRVFEAPLEDGSGIEDISRVEAHELDSWSGRPFAMQVIRYRIRKPKGLTILEGLLENLPKEVEVTR